jgi:hypothetical protein
VILRRRSRMAGATVGTLDDRGAMTKLSQLWDS